MKILTRLKRIVKACLIYRFDILNDKRYSQLVTEIGTRQEMLLSSLVVEAHTIEKGLTMPNKHFPFGEAKAQLILNGCKEYVRRGYDLSNPRFLDIVSIMKEYRDTHVRQGKDVSKISEQVDVILQAVSTEVDGQQNYAVSKENYFAHGDDAFDVFSNSRHSCRNLTGHVNDEALQAALSLSMNTPSTCNRQSHRVHLFQSNAAKKTILTIQNGCRGFGDLADQFILVTSDLSCWESGKVRHAPYVDGGIYVMNLLYCLHFKRIAACTLNMYLDASATSRLHKELCIPNNEVPVALIAIGIPPAKFDLARSHRRQYEEITKKH